MNDLPRCDEPVEKLCYRCIHKPSTGSSLDGRLVRGYSSDRQTCDGCGRGDSVCWFRPAVTCTGCGNVIHVEPSKCGHDGCENTYCIVCAPKWLPAENGGCCVSHANVLRYHASQHEQFFGAATAKVMERVDEALPGAFRRTG